MSFLKELYEQSLAETEKNIRLWEEYLDSHRSLDFTVFSDQLKVPALIPIGSRVFFRGEIKHTNEVTVALGADYFVKCSVKQAEVLKEHRIKNAESKLLTYKKEKEYLENQMSINKSTGFDNDEGQEIVEVHTEEEEKAWRAKHRENLKKYKLGKAETDEAPTLEVTDEELWNRLEELELEEELANELNINENTIVEKNKENSFIVKEESLLLSSKKENLKTSESPANANILYDEVKSENKINTILKKYTDTSTDILQQVLEKQNELENKLSELKTREKPESKTENDLISKLDEMDQLDELEDEIDRLDDMLQNRGKDNEQSLSEQNDEDVKPKSVKLKKSISFADEDDGETLELEFEHSKIEPILDSYDPKKGILKPSDIYTAYSNLFDQKTSSILKKSKYGGDTVLKEKAKVKTVGFATIVDSEEDFEEEMPKTIVVKDVVEKSVPQEKKVEMGARPTSLFKKKRMQQNKPN